MKLMNLDYIRVFTRIIASWSGAKWDGSRGECCVPQSGWLTKRKMLVGERVRGFRRQPRWQLSIVEQIQIEASV